MCLTLKKNESFLIAKEDITVYKILRKSIFHHDETGDNIYYYTPYAGMEVKVCSGFVIKPQKLLLKETLKFEIERGDRYFSLGLIHAYQTTEDFERRFKSTCYYFSPFYEKERFQCKFILVECYIPKGEYYILGEENDIAASELVVRKVVSD